jgi:GTPase Era involved in 16S rRNA processing
MYKNSFELEDTIGNDMVTDPISLQMLAYPVGFNVCNLISKFIYGHFAKPEADDSRQEELKKQHQFRLEELKQQYEQSLAKSLFDSKIRINEQEIIKKLDASASIQINQSIKKIDRENANSPFFDASEITQQHFSELHRETGLPIVLVAPFWNDSRTKQLNEQGGYVDFRNAFNTCYEQVKWGNLALKQDGYFKRPLYQTDRDINYIYSVLSDLPIILIHGKIMGVETGNPEIKRIFPTITSWNLYPEQQNGYGNLNLNFIPVEIPTQPDEVPISFKDQQKSINMQKVIGRYSLSLQDYVGQYLAKAVGLLSSFYHLYHFETRPNLQQFQINEEKELEALSLQVNEHYNFLGKLNPNKLNTYELEKLTLSLEHEIAQIRRSKKASEKNKNKPNFSTEEINAWFSERLERMASTIDQEELSQETLPLSISTEELRKVSRRLLNKNFRILVIGDFNRGKSTLINALLGKDVVPRGVVATTALPTFIKYGKREEVLVYRKNGTTERLSIKEYQERYTLNSKVKFEAKKLYGSLNKWLNSLDHAEIYCPIKLLSDGTEFIDTPGLNSTEVEEEQVFQYIKDCDLTFFILDAKEQFTQKEKKYVTRISSFQEDLPNEENLNKIRLQAKPIFYLINKWDWVTEEGKEEVLNAFNQGFCECLDIDYNEAKKMLGNTVFHLSGEIALEKLIKSQSIEGTGLWEFRKRMSNFWKNERITAKLSQAILIAEIVKSQITSQMGAQLDLPEQVNLDQEAKAKYLTALQNNISTQVELMKAKYYEVC